jgi:hypothetical protein
MLETPQSAYFIALHWMYTGRSPLGPADVQASTRQLDLMPLQVA